MALLSLIAGFIAGVLAVIAAEALGFFLLLRRLTAPKTVPSPSGGGSDYSDSADRHLSPPSVYQKQGIVWILEPEKVPKVPPSGERSKKKEILEVSPVRKFAKIKDRSLILTDPDGSQVVILKGCRVVAVSATSLPSRKWAKRYPIKVESQTTELYNGSKLLYLYLETSSEKESWCKALRFASCKEKETIYRLSKLNEEFHSYLRSLIEGYPSLVKPFGGCDMGPSNKDCSNDIHSSKVRTLWKKLSKKAPKSSPESKSTSPSTSSHGERRVVEKCRSFQDGLVRHAFKSRMSTAPSEDGSAAQSASQSNGSEISDSDADEKNVVDEGTLCWNLLVSRLFFDAKSNVDVRNSLKARIQRSLSNMRMPSYVGEVTCTDVDPGNLPPYIHSMRAVPTDMNDECALEMDIEYSGGMVLFVEARLEVGELHAQNGRVSQDMESSSDGELTTHLLEGFENLGDELKLSHTSIESREQNDLVDSTVDRIKSVKSSTSVPNSESRWKSIVNSVAKQVNQVSFSLAIRVASLKGTIQFHIKPPPSDQLWVGFSSMPDINFHVEPSVADHKFSSTRIALYLVNRFKAAIRETVVLPNCESLTIPFMLAEKDDWIARNLAPLIWVKHDVPSNPKPVPEAGGADQQETRELKLKKQNPAPEPVESSSSSQSREAAPQESNQQIREENAECESQTRYVSLKEERSILGEDEDGRGKRTGKRAKMRELAKKMGEKLEEKRQHLEEKSRLIVEKMRTPAALTS